MEVAVSERAVLVDSEANVEADVLGLVSLADFRIVIVIIVKVVAGNRPHVECGTLGQGFINILKYIYKPLLLVASVENCKTRTLRSIGVTGSSPALFSYTLSGPNAGNEEGGGGERVVLKSDRCVFSGDSNNLSK